MSLVFSNSRLILNSDGWTPEYAGPIEHVIQTGYRLFHSQWARERAKTMAPISEIEILAFPLLLVRQAVEDVLLSKVCEIYKKCLPVSLHTCCIINEKTEMHKFLNKTRLPRSNEKALQYFRSVIYGMSLFHAAYSDEDSFKTQMEFIHNLLKSHSKSDVLFDLDCIIERVSNHIIDVGQICYLDYRAAGETETKSHLPLITRVFTHSSPASEYVAKINFTS